MLNYILFIFSSIILLLLLHYIYDKIKDSIIYCNNYIPLNNYKNANKIFNTENIEKHTEEVNKST